MVQTEEKSPAVHESSHEDHDATSTFHPWTFLIFMIAVGIRSYQLQQEVSALLRVRVERDLVSVLGKQDGSSAAEAAPGLPPGGCGGDDGGGDDLCGG